jgi:hypothetical protein
MYPSGKAEFFAGYKVPEGSCVPKWVIRLYPFQHGGPVLAAPFPLCRRCTRNLSGTSGFPRLAVIDYSGVEPYEPVTLGNGHADIRPGLDQPRGFFFAPD